MSTLYVDNLEPNLGSQVEIPDFKPHAGMVIQQVSYHSDATWSTTSGNFSSTYAAVTITPKFANSKMSIWVSGSVHYSGYANHGRGQIRKNGATFSNHDNEDLLAYWAGTTSRGDMVGQNYVDQNVGTTSPVTYAYYVASSSGAATYFYRNHGIIVQEIAQ